MERPGSTADSSKIVCVRIDIRDATENQLKLCQTKFLFKCSREQKGGREKSIEKIDGLAVDHEQKVTARREEMVDQEWIEARVNFLIVSRV
jgi:hypothetical protein